MPNAVLITNTRRLAIAVFCGIVALSAMAALAAPTPSRMEKSGATYRYEHTGEAYVFDAAWRTESLWNQKAGSSEWTRVSNPDPEHVALLRKAMLSRLRRNSVLDIPAEGAEDIRSLRALGYL